MCLNLEDISKDLLGSVNWKLFRGILKLTILRRLWLCLSGGESLVHKVSLIRSNLVRKWGCKSITMIKISFHCTPHIDMIWKLIPLMKEDVSKQLQHFWKAFWILREDLLLLSPAWLWQTKRLKICWIVLRSKTTPLWWSTSWKDCQICWIVGKIYLKHIKNKFLNKKLYLKWWE